MGYAVDDMTVYMCVHLFIYTKPGQDLVKPCCFLFEELFKLFKADESILRLINLLQKTSSWTIMTTTSTVA